MWVGQGVLERCGRPFNPGIVVLFSYILCEFRFEGVQMQLGVFNYIISICFDGELVV